MSVTARRGVGLAYAPWENMLREQEEDDYEWKVASKWKDEVTEVGEGDAGSERGKLEAGGKRGSQNVAGSSWQLCTF